MGTTHRPDRRRFLRSVASAWGASAALAVDARSAQAGGATQDQWRKCGKCKMMFYGGYHKSICPAGRRHDAELGANFVLPYNVPETPKAQGAWRFCNKCQSLFFDGYPAKGVCPAGAGHVAQGYVFVLPHDVRDVGYTEKDWRFCNKCDALFYNRDQDKGRCAAAAGGGHVAQGFNFVLRFRGNLENDNVALPAQE